MRLYLVISLFLTQAFVTSAEQAFLSQEYIQVDTKNTSKYYDIDYKGKWKIIGQTELGDLQKSEYGPNGYLGCGVSLRIEADQKDQDDTSTNAVEIVFCNIDSWNDKKRIKLNEGLFGEWTDPVFCPQDWYIYGANIQIEKKQGEGDDTAVNGIEILCSKLDGTGSERKVLGRGWGDWTNNHSSPGSFVCGGRVRFQKFQGKGVSGAADDNALTGLELKMCYLVKP